MEEIKNTEPKPGTKDALKAENEVLNAENEALNAENEALKAQLEALLANRKVAVKVPEDTGPKMVKIRIPKTKEEKDDVFVSVNFRTYQIQRGVEVEVPDFVAEVLANKEKMLEEIMLFEEQVQTKN
jgi:hypothetical protein